MQLISPADQPLRCEPASHARQYGRGQRGWKRAGSLRRPAPCWRCHLRPYRPQHQPPPAARRLLASAARRPSATHQPLMGSLLPTFDPARLGQHSGQSRMLVVHLALRPMSAFGLDDRAKASATTSGGDPRSPAPTTLSSPVAPARLYDATSSRTRTAAGMSLAQTPPGLPPQGGCRAGSLSGTDGELPCQAGRSAERRCPHERGVPSPRLGHMPSEPSAHCPFQGLFHTPHNFAPDGPDDMGNAGRHGGGPLITRTEEARGSNPLTSTPP